MATVTKKQKKGDAEDIVVLEGLEAVRTRPGMYIGTTDTKGKHHILWEIIDNAIDEAANGFADRVEVTINEDGSATVQDNGRGIPVDINPKHKKSGVELVFTVLHAGGKFNNDTYKFSGGLHGVGASVTNALSKWLTVDVFKNKRHYRQCYESRMFGNKFRSGYPTTPLEDLGPSKITGSRISFMPDSAMFKDAEFEYDRILNKIRELAFLNKGITLLFQDKREDPETEKGSLHKFYYKEGVADYMAYLNRNEEILNKKIIYFEDKQPKFEVYVAMQYTKGEGETIRSYVNNIRTEEGGTHETGFKSGLTKALNKYIKGAKVAKAGKKELTFSGEDFLDGLTVIVSIKMQNVEFEGQTKTKLGSKDVRQAVETIVSREIGLILSSPSNKSLVKMIMEKATNACKVRESGKRAKDLQRHKNGLGAEVLVGKFSSCSGRNAEKNEIFIVEGNSAGGSAKQGRDRSFQAVLPLRGKPLNAEKKSKEQVWKNEEFKALIYALGTDIDKDFNINNLKFGKVIILADADQDGGHISSILLTFFYKYMRELITNGNVYLGMPPLYKIEHKGKTSYVYNDAELQEFLPTIKGKYTLQRYKGLGEMNPEQLWETTLNPATRVLTQVVIDDSDKAREMVKTFMGSNTQDRKEYISNNASFGKVADAETEE